MIRLPFLRCKRLQEKSPDRAAFDERLLSVSEVARLLQVSRSLVYLLVRRGDLPSVRVGRLCRLHPSDLWRYLERHTRS